MQQQTQMILMPLGNYFNKRHLCKIAKCQKKHRKFIPQICPNRVQRKTAEVKKSTNMPTSTAKTTRSERSYRISNRRRSNKNYDLVGSSFSYCTGTIRTANNQSNANSSDNSRSNNGYDPIATECKSYERRNTNTSGHLLLTMLLSTTLILEANSSVAVPTVVATNLLTKLKNTTAMDSISYLSASAESVSVTKAAHDTAALRDTGTNNLTTTTMTVQSTLSSSAPPVLSLISATTITNVPDTINAVGTALSSLSFHAPLYPHPSLPLAPTPQTTPNALITFPETTFPPSSDFAEELFTKEAVIATTTTENVESANVGLQRPPSSDVLLKGFSIPTFLPPFPAFAMADLSSFTVTPTLAPADTPPDSQNQLHLVVYKQNALRQNLSVSAVNITVQMGNHAYLPCKIHRLLNKPISWVRLRDGHILSVDQATFIADQRFQSIFQGEDEYTWSLQIKYVQNTDEGWYECQVSTEPKLSAKVYLGVVVPHTELIGDQNRFVKEGSKVALHCIVRDTLDPPSYIIWFREKTQITSDNKLGWYTEIDRTIFGNADSNRNTIGSLIIPFVRKKDSGNYTCQPSNSSPVSVDLHVLSGEYSASAIMSAASSYRVSGKLSGRLLFLLALLAILKA